MKNEEQNVEKREKRREERSSGAGGAALEWLPGFREMFVCQEPAARQLLPPEQLQREEQKYWEDFVYMIGMLPSVAGEIFYAADALLDRYEAAGSSMYAEYPDQETMRKIADKLYEKLAYHETERTMQAADGTAVLNPYFVEAEFRTGNTPLYDLILVMIYWNVGYRRQRYGRRQKIFQGR